MRNLPISDTQWIFDQSHLDHTPSREDGIRLQEELERRKKCIEFIRSLGLRAGQATWKQHTTEPRGVMPVASTLVHRFYMRRSLKDFGEKLVAPTILFLASKIEEESLKLRFIVNSCLGKWEPNAVQWYADAHGNYPPQSPEYRRWEREILAAEELALEVLCFNMAIEQPWAILEKSIRGLQPISKAQANGKGKERLSESVIRDVASTLFIPTMASPLSILTHPDVLAFAMFVLTLALRGQMPLSQALAAAAERAESFSLGIRFDPDKGAVGDDVPAVKQCLDEYIEYSRMGIIEGGAASFIYSESPDPPQYSRLCVEPANGNDHEVVMHDAA